MEEKNKKSLLPRYWALSVLVILTGLALCYVREMIAPLAIAGLLAYVMNPVVDLLAQRPRFPRSLAIWIVFLALLGLAAFLSTLIIPVLLDEIATLTSDLDTSLAAAQEFLAKPIKLLQWEIRLDRFLPDVSGMLSEQLTGLPENVLKIIESTTTNLIRFLIIVAATYYLLQDWVRLRDWLLSVPPTSYQPVTRQIYQEVKGVWNGYLRGNLVLMVIVWISFSLAWLAIGLPGALVLGIIAGLLTIIPDLGPAIAGGLAVVVALIEGSSYLPVSNFWFALIVFGLYLLLVNIKSIWLRPRIYGHSVHMHDGIVFVAIMAAVIVQGILGALIVTPLLASLGVVGKYIYRGLLGLPLLEQSPDEEKEKTEQPVKTAERSDAAQQ